MKNIRVVWISAISFFLLSYTYVVFFFLNRRYVPVDHRGVQTEVEYLIQQFNKQDVDAYIVILLHFLNVLIISGAIFYTVKKSAK